MCIRDRIDSVLPNSFCTASQESFELILFGSIASISSSTTINVMPNPKIEVKARGNKIDFKGFSITCLVIQNLIENSLFFEINEDSSLLDK